MTTIQINEKLWLFLNQKRKVGESFNDLIERLLKINLKNGRHKKKA